MENKSKIVLILSLVLLVISCKDKEKQTITDQLKIDGVIKDNLGRLYVENNQLIFECQCLYSNAKEKDDFYVVNDNVIKFKKIIDMKSDTIPLEKVIDQNTFHLLGLEDEEKEKIRNLFFLNGRLNCYYADKNFTYAFADKPNPEFKIIGDADKAIFIGGNYMKISEKIYSNGIEVKNVDYNSFKTFEVSTERIERKLTIGSDKKHLFLDEKIMTKKDFDRLIAPNDSLKEKYFKYF